MATVGTVYLVGAGPGDPGLITVRGARAVSTADVLVYDGLVGDGLLELASDSCELIYAGKKRSVHGKARSQSEICALLVERALSGQSVVRLKGGDPLIFGRVSEELDALSGASIPFEIVPGVSSLTAAPAYAGIPITRRGVASTVAFATGHAAAGRALTEADFAAFANADTVVLFMAVSTLGDCVARLIAAGRAAETPAAAIYWGTTSAQRTISSSLGELPEMARDAGLKPPALIVVGDVSAPLHRYQWREALPLAGARVLIGRSHKRAQLFAAAIAKLGGEPLVAPLTRLVGVEDEARRLAMAKLDRPFGWILFTSANGVEHFIAALLSSGRDLRILADARIGCVGESTATALHKCGLAADLLPSIRSSAGLGDALLALLGPDQRPRVVIVRADGGRADADERLSAAGLEVCPLPLYRSIAADPQEHRLARGLARLQAGEIDIVPFFAPSQVSALFAHVGDAVSLLENAAVIGAVGKTTAAALRRRGTRVDVVASKPNPEIFAKELANAYRVHRGRIEEGQR